MWLREHVWRGWFEWNACPLLDNSLKQLKALISNITASVGFQVVQCLWFIGVDHRIPIPSKNKIQWIIVEANSPGKLCAHRMYPAISTTVTKTYYIINNRNLLLLIETQWDWRYISKLDPEAIDQSRLSKYQICENGK